MNCLYSYNDVVFRKRASMNFPSKDGSDPTREKLQKERSRIGKLETIMQDGDIFVNQIMTVKTHCLSRVNYGNFRFFL